MNSKGYIVSPIVFIVFLAFGISLLLALEFHANSFEKGIILSAKIDRGILEIQKSEIDMINFGKLSSYLCSNQHCFNITGENEALEECVEQFLSDRFGFAQRDAELFSSDSFQYISFAVGGFNATNINMSSEEIVVRSRLSEVFLNICGG